MERKMAWLHVFPSVKGQEECKKMISKTSCRFLSTTFFEKVVLKVQGFCTFNIYHGEWEGCSAP